ncbi:MAG: YmdB family metallophosphoesterase [Phycisphaerales bacterium]|nr:YmdB family metallophosphoesterase [Phycisphaerales bacterium]
MPEITVAFLGDIVGSPGRRVVQQQLPRLRADHAPDLVIANAENARSGSGLSPSIYERLRALGIDAITLGDHAFRDPKIVPILERGDAPIARPANLSARALGKRITRLPLAAPGRSLFIVTVLGRVFFPMPADDPFATVDGILEQLPDRDGIVIVEAHMEATSEKIALARYLDGRVAAVLGTHTHVPTADARILTRGTAFITDVGMCGPYDSIIGRDVESVLRHMTTAAHVQFPVAEHDAALCGVVVRIDLASRRATSIERVEYRADHDASPFTEQL